VLERPAAIKNFFEAFSGWIIAAPRKKDMIIVSGFDVYPNEI